jgi:hypothetical protein
MEGTSNGQLTKIVLFDQLLKNQGEELSTILIKIWLSMVQLHYQKEEKW